MYLMVLCLLENSFLFLKMSRCVTERFLHSKQQQNNQANHPHPLLSQPVTTSDPATTAPLIRFIKRSRVVESNLRYSNETNSVKEDTLSAGDAPV